MYKGVDIGNGYTKFGRLKFASRIKVGERINFGKPKDETHYVTYNGTHYIVGDGSIFTGDTRYFTTEYLLCLLTALALSAESDGVSADGIIESDIVIGLPEKKHKRIASSLEEHLKSLDTQHINVDGKDYNIKITNVIVFIEGAYPIKTEEEENVIVIDNGAGTINVTQWEGLSISNSATYTESMYKMFANISNYLNLEKGADLKPMEVENLINAETTVIDQEVVDITDIRPIIANHIKEIASYIRNDFKVSKAARIYLLGGGGSATESYWVDEFPKIKLVDNSQFVNADIYNAIASAEFKHD